MSAYIPGLDLEPIAQTAIMVSLRELQGHFKKSLETAECHLRLDEACPEPRVDGSCAWGTTKFCAARLKIAARESLEYDAQVAKRERVERAELIALPKYLWSVLGVDRPAALRETEAIDFVRHAAGANRMRIVVLQGPDGAGKATAAAWWCWSVGGWFYRATNLRWFTRGGWYRDSGDNRLLSSPAVAIVGLDKPWATKDGSHKHSLVHVCHDRLDSGKLTLITTNLPQSEIEQVLGPSLCSSIRRWSGMRQIKDPIDGSSQQAAY